MTSLFTATHFLLMLTLHSGSQECLGDKATKDLALVHCDLRPLTSLCFPRLDFFFLVPWIIYFKTQCISAAEAKQSSFFFLEKKNKSIWPTCHRRRQSADASLVLWWGGGIFDICAEGGFVMLPRIKPECLEHAILLARLHRVPSQPVLLLFFCWICKSFSSLLNPQWLMTVVLLNICCWCRFLLAVALLYSFEISFLQ